MIRVIAFVVFDVDHVFTNVSLEPKKDPGMSYVLNNMCYEMSCLR